MTDMLIGWLDNMADAQFGLVGGKAANLMRLGRLGLPVPPGFVITTDAYHDFLVTAGLNDLAPGDPEQLAARLLDAPLPDALGGPILEAYRRLGGAAVAVRSSATAEDLAAASFAGQYDTVLNVEGPEALLCAVRACWASLWTPRAIAYRRERGWDGNGDDRTLAIAVVVQQMVPADAAGVAFTANPVTGNRDETVISAVRGLGERLVSGEAAADEWVVRDGEAICRHSPERALTTAQARAVAGLARRIADAFGAPQDVEWASAGEALYVLQARPMTALPEVVAWRAPLPGGWMRNFRLGEWLPEPVTPLCDSWLLLQIEAAEFATQACYTGVRPRSPYHVTVHGWYYSSPIGAGVSPRGALLALLRHPRRILSLPLSLIRPELAERTLLAPLDHRWRTELLPRYQQVVAFWQERVATAYLDKVSALPDAIEAIEAIAAVAGDYLWVFSVVGGHAWKAERALARFCQRHLAARVGRSHQELLRGLPAPFLAPQAHAVQSLDWVRPTLGEDAPRDGGSDGGSVEPGALGTMEERHRRLEAERHAAETACRAALAGQPRRRRRFEVLLAHAQRYAAIREEQAGWFTLGWPVLRQAVLRLGDELYARGAIAHRDDVFFLTRAEVVAGLHHDAQQLASLDLPDRPDGADLTDLTADTANGAAWRARVASRRQEWEWQRRLTPPLTLGAPLGERLIAGAVEAMRMPAAAHQAGAAVLTGMPASPGRATGPVRVVRGPDDFASFQSGEVLVAHGTAPAWTLLFERAAAVVTDGGSVAAHASLVAREYGIPGVVGTGDATARLRDGQIVTVDGSAGLVELRP